MNATTNPTVEVRAKSAGSDTFTDWQPLDNPSNWKSTSLVNFFHGSGAIQMSVTMPNGGVFEFHKV